MSSAANENDGARGDDPRDDHHDHDHDRVMDWALGERLGERLGGVQPPDLVEAVRGRLLDADAVPIREATNPRAQWFAAAAVLVLGSAVVIGVAFWPKLDGIPVGVPLPVTPLPAPQEPKRVQVVTLADVKALPADTRAVEAFGVDDTIVEALTRLRELEELSLREPWHESFGLSLKMQEPPNAKGVTAAAWPHLLSFKKLRKLELSGTTRVGFVAPGDRAGLDWAALGDALEALPLLETLTLRCLDTPNELLARLPQARSLRALDLSFNHGFEAAGIDAILQCKSLRRLSLKGCQQLSGDLLARLAELSELEELDLSSIDGLNWRSHPGFLDDDEKRMLELARQQAMRGAGPTDTTLAALATAPKLRVLDVGGGSWTAAGLAALGASKTLRELVAFGGHVTSSNWVASLPNTLERLEVCGDYRDDLCAQLAQHQPNLRSLNLAACDEITDTGVAALRALRQLRVLDLRQMRGLTAASIDTLAQMTWLEELDLRHCDFVTAAHVVRLRRALRGLRALATNVPEAAVRAIAFSETPPRVESLADAEALPQDVRAVAAVKLGREAMAALATRHTIEHVEVRSSDLVMMPATSGGAIRRDGELAVAFAELERLPRLRRLTFGTLDGLGDDVFAVAARFPALRELDLSGAWASERAMADLARLPLTTLVWRRGTMPSPDAPKQLAAMRTLRELVIDGGPALAADALASLAALDGLQRLTLSRIPGTLVEVPVDGRTVAMRTGGPGDGHGVTHDVVLALARLPRLEELDVEGAELRPEGLRALRAVTTLRRLRGVPANGEQIASLPPQLTELGLCGGVLDELGAQVVIASLPRLVRIELDATARIDDGARAAIVFRPGLQLVEPGSAAPRY